MLCSNCKHEIKPVVVFDIDGTLGKYHEHFLQFAQGYLGMMLYSNYDGSMEFHDWLGIELKDYRAAKLAYRQGGLKRTMPTYPFAAQAVQAAREAGAEVWIATTRPYNRLDNIDPDTVEWCRRNGILFDGLLYGDDKYAQLASHVDPARVVRVYDDLPEQLRIAGEIFPGKTTLMGRQHNAHHRNETGVFGIQLARIPETLPIAIEHWKEQNAA